MGITSLAKLIADTAPNVIKEYEIKSLFGRKVAIDASMTIYQFLIAIRQDGNTLMNESGETTSHLNGLFYRTIRMLENGIKPVYVFDGTPPEMKSHELSKRSERRDEVQEQLKKAIEHEDKEAIDKFNRRLVKVTREHSEECQKLLSMMGVPFIQVNKHLYSEFSSSRIWSRNFASGEAEAQCAALVKAGKVFATATEDMDALTFGSDILIRHLTFSEARKLKIKEFSLQKLLTELQLELKEFVDMCILLGCDYCESIKGIGPKKALEMIKTHRTIDTILDHLDLKKFTVPPNWKYSEARELFLNPDVTDVESVELKWDSPKEEELIEFMVKEKGFKEDRIKSGIKKLFSCKTSSSQGRLDNFFKVVSVSKTSALSNEKEN